MFFAAVLKPAQGGRRARTRSARERDQNKAIGKALFAALVVTILALSTTALDPAPSPMVLIIGALVTMTIVMVPLVR